MKDQLQCHVHDEVGPWKVGIRENVCVPADEHSFTEFEGKFYCLFHLPTIDKDIAKFESLFQARLESVETKVVDFGKLQEEEQLRARAKGSILYNFPFVWFPSRVYLGDYKFNAQADFSSATFSAAVSFAKATFSNSAFFNGARFLSAASFRSTTFSGGAHFKEAQFSANAKFFWATFEANAYFESVIFSGETDFEKTTFSETYETEFYKANFAKDTFFDKTEFNGNVVFNSAVFGADSDVIFRGAKFGRNANFQYCTAEGLLRFSDLQLRSRTRFDFQEAAFEKASRVSFHTISLRPHWFVNVDSRKFVFTDVLWRNLDWDFWNRNIYAELASLPGTGIAEQKKRIFEVAARQLAVNAEENNRYDEAAKFRYMAMETRRLEETKHFRASRFLIWLYKWSSGYGEIWIRAALVLLFIWFGFGLAYWLFGSFQIETPLDVGQSLGYSSQVMLLQKPNPRPLSNLTFTLYVLETISAPLQAALLALAIRRKFMR